MTRARNGLTWGPQLRLALPLLVAVIAALTATWVYYDGRLRAERRVEETAARELTRSMTQLQWTLTHARRRGNPEVVNNVLAELGADPSVSVAHVVDGRGRVITSTRMAAVGHAPKLSAASQRLFAQARERLAGMLRQSANGDVVEAVYPLALDTPEDRRDPRRVGLVYVRRDLSAIKAVEVVESRRALLQFCAIFFPLMVLFGLVVHRLVSARLGRLVAVAHRFARGEAIDGVPVTGGDEVGRLARSFERMIHAREEAEASIRRLSRAIERSPIAIGMVAPDGELDYGNDAFSRWYHGCCAGQASRWMERVGSLASSGPLLVDAAAAGTEWQAEIVRVVEAEQRTEAITIVPLQDDGRDDPAPRFLVLVEDVTERRRIEEERSRLGLVLEQTTESIVVTDLEGRIDYVNPAFEDNMQWSAADVRGLAIERLGDSSGEGAGRYRAACAEVAATDGAWAGRVRNQRRDGSTFVAEATIAPVHIGRRRLGAVSVQRDITVQLGLEEQLRQAQRMEAVGQLAGGVAHDFNNLLTVIIGSCSFLSRKVGQDAREDVRNISEAAQRAAALTGQLLAFGRRQILKPVLADMVELVESIGSLLDRLLREDIQLEVRMPEVLGPVCIDIAQMEQAIINLCLNARDAMPRGGTIEISGRLIEITDSKSERRGLEPGPHVLVEVRDTGEGIAPEVLPHVFEPFFTTKPVGKGTGLGLSTVYGIVAQSAGAVEVDSEPGKGSCFRILLPLAQGALHQKEVEEEVPSRRTGGAEVLVVEDDEAVRRAVSRMLVEDGHVVHLASGEDAALALYEVLDPRPALLITDVVLEQGSGVELATELRRRDESLRILFMSGYTADDLGRAGLGDSAAVELLHKPFTPAELRGVVDDVLARPVARPRLPEGSA